MICRLNNLGAPRTVCGLSRVPSNPIDVGGIRDNIDRSYLFHRIWTSLGSWKSIHRCLKTSEEAQLLLSKASPSQNAHRRILVHPDWCSSSHFPLDFAGLGLRSTPLHSLMIDL